MNPVGSRTNFSRKSAYDRHDFRQKLLNRLVTVSFHPSWQLLIQIVIVLSIFNAVYVTFFSKDDSNLFRNYYYLEIIFFYDTAVAYIHRFYVRKFSLNSPRNVIILLADTLSILPIYECCYIACPEYATTTLLKRQQLKSVLRVFHLVASLFQEKFVSVHVHLTKLKITHVILLLLINLMFACWWSYQGRCWPDCSTPNWTDSLVHLTGLRLEEPIEWFLSCFSIIGNVIIHGSPGFIIDQNDTEAIIMLMSMIAGFTMHSFIDVAHIFNNYRDLIEYHHAYHVQLRKLKFLLHFCQSQDEYYNLEQRTFQYYEVLWHKRKGVIVNEELIKGLPLILVKEIMVDVFHEAISHTHLFCNLSSSLRRELCIHMRTEYYLSGDNLYSPGQTFSDMLYIYSGYVNVTSKEDHRTPILTFSSGTILSEISLFIVLTSTSVVQCATNCEIKLLSMEAYNRIAHRYHDNFKDHREHIQSRIKIARARTIKAAKETVVRCKKFKTQWRCVAQLHNQSHRGVGITEIMWNTLDKSFYSKYLDLIILTDSMMPGKKIICLTGECPCVMNPTSSFRKLFIYLHLVVVVIHAFLLPYNYIFLDDIPDYLVLMNLVIDLFFFFDIYMQAISYIVINGIEIVDAKIILMHKLKNLWFLLDLFTTIPYDYIGALTNLSNRSYFYLRLPKIIQWYKLFKLALTLQYKVVGQTYSVIIFKYFVLYSALLYLSTCYHYMWFNFGQYGPDLTQGNWPIKLSPILSCIMYNLSAINLLGISERVATNLHGLLLYTILTFTGCHLLNFCIVELTCINVKNQENLYNHFKKFKIVDDFLKTNSMSVKYNTYVYNYYNFWWDYNKNIDVMPDVTMPEFHIHIKNLTQILRQVPALNSMCDKLLELIALRAHVHLHPPGFTLSCVDDRNIYLNIIVKGYCSMALFMPGDRERNIIKILKPGDYFNLLEMFHNLDSFNTITTLTAVLELSICRSDIFDVLECDKTELKIFRNTLKWHYDKYHNLFEKTESSDFLLDRPEMLEKSKKKSNNADIIIFRYSINDDYDFGHDKIKKKILRKQLGIFRFILLKQSINPHHKYYIAWEILRSAVAIIFGFSTFLNETILKEFVQSQFILLLIAEIVFFVDIYLRFHLQYYNEENINVTAITSTIEHYLKTSLLLDTIAIIPCSRWPIYIDKIYQFSINVIISLVYYIALFYRPVLGLRYIERHHINIRQVLAIALRNTIIIVTLVAIVGNNMLLAVCTFREGNGYNCTSTANYISTSPFANVTDTLHLFIFHLYAVSERIHTDIVGVSEYPLMDDVQESLIINILLWCFKLYLVSKIVSATIGCNAIVINHAKTQFQNFATFVKHELVSEKIVEEVKNHFDFVHLKNGGRPVDDIFNKLSDRIRLNIKSEMFMKTLKVTPFFRAIPVNSLMIFLHHFDAKYYKIGAEVIRCNNVQDNIYVVSKGSVNITVARDTLVTLTRGGAFGCFAEKGITRQTIFACANFNVELLVIKTSIFFKQISEYPNLLEKFRRMNGTIEYFDSSEAICEFSDVTKSNKTLKLALAYSKLYDMFNKRVRFNSKHYKRYSIAVIHIAAISSILLIFLSFYRRYWILATYCYICDVFFWTHMVIMFHIQYIDPFTGLLITDPDLIRKRYLKSLTFWVTFLGTLPIEIVPLAANMDSLIVECCFYNRLLRFSLAIIHNHELNKKLSVSQVFQWCYILYLITFQIGAMALVWYTVAFNIETCLHRVSTGPKKEMSTTEDRNAILLSIMYTVTIFTTANIRSVSSTTLAQIEMTLIISTASLIINSIMTGVLASLLLIKDITESCYKSKLQRMKLYFNSLHVSPYLRSRIYESMVLLWMKRKGELLPQIIHEAPSYLQQDIMFSIYGFHLVNHDLFGKMHNDMVRQICVLLKVGLYIPEQLIVSAGDCDGYMYFLHRGVVRVYDDKTEETFDMSISSSFGEEQGIYGLPHRRTYTAYTTIDLLLLEKTSWEYLLKWFPAAREILQQNFAMFSSKSKTGTNDA